MIGCAALIVIAQLDRSHERARRWVNSDDVTGNGEEPEGFGALLREHRIAAGLTQEALADRAGLSVRGIADLERGARRYPHFHTLRSLAQALELDPADRVALLAAGQRPAPPDPAGLVVAAECRCESCGREDTLGAGVLGE